MKMSAPTNNLTQKLIAQRNKVLRYMRRMELKQNKKYSEVPLRVITALFDDVEKLNVWGDEVLRHSSEKRATYLLYAPSIAIAYQFFVLTLLYQIHSLGEDLASSKLSVGHFPAKKQQHAAQSIRIVFGDMALALLHNAVLAMPASESQILEWELVFARLSRKVFVKLLKHGTAQDLRQMLSAEAKALGDLLVSAK